MNYIILIIVAVGGIVLGHYFSKRSDVSMPEQSMKKAENKGKILDFFRQSQEGRITNNDIEKLLGVSDATAGRYLEELEKEGKIQQHGETGQSVFYTLSAGGI